MANSMTQSAHLDLDLSDLELRLVVGGTGSAKPANVRCALPEMSSADSAPVATSPALVTSASSTSSAFGLPEFLAAVAHDAVPVATDVGHELTTLLGLPESGGDSIGLPADPCHASPDTGADASTSPCDGAAVLDALGDLHLPECGSGAGDGGGHHGGGHHDGDRPDVPSAGGESHSCSWSHHEGDDGKPATSADAGSTALPEATFWSDGGGGSN
jgi:hypothetical protein